MYQFYCFPRQILFTVITNPSCPFAFTLLFIILSILCRYSQFCAFISVIELPRIPAYCPKPLYNCLLQFHWLQYKQFHFFSIKLFIKIIIKILSFFYNLLFVIYIKENIFFLIMNNICFYFFC